MECQIKNPCTAKYRLTIMLILAATNIFLVIQLKRHSSYNNLQSFKRSSPEPITDKIGNMFLPLLTNKEKEGLQKAVAAFNGVQRFNVTYFLFYGALLGSYRHHGFIPWDKDIDLLVKKEDQTVLLKYLQSLKSEFGFTTNLGEVWRFFHKDAFLSDYGWRWPYIDIFFYEGDTGHIWVTYIDDMNLKYDRQDVFPLIERPFMDMMLPAPRNTPLVLSKKYYVNMCRSNIYAFNDDIFSNPKQVVEIPCNFLKDRLPFVNRYSFNATHSYEMLQLNGSQYMKYPTYLLPK